MKTVLLVGAASHVGQAILAHLHKDYRFIATYHRQQPPKWANVRYYPLDVSQPMAVEQLAQQLSNEAEALYGIIHCAAVRSVSMAPISDIPLEEWSRIMQINLNSVFYVVKYLMPLLREVQDSRLLLFSSMVAESGLRFGGAYAASKAALLGLLRSLVLEESAYGLRANLILPGPIRGNEAKFDEEYQAFRERSFQQWSQKIPLGRVAEAIDMVGLVAFLLASQSAYITGQAFHVDGGLGLVGRDL